MRLQNSPKFFQPTFISRRDLAAHSRTFDQDNKFLATACLLNVNPAEQMCDDFNFNLNNTNKTLSWPLSCCSTVFEYSPLTIVLFWNWYIRRDRMRMLLVLWVCFRHFLFNCSCYASLTCSAVTRSVVIRYSVVIARRCCFGYRFRLWLETQSSHYCLRTLHDGRRLYWNEDNDGKRSSRKWSFRQSWLV